jgi:hypothetical protein
MSSVHLLSNDLPACVLLQVFISSFNVNCRLQNAAISTQAHFFLIFIATSALIIAALPNFTAVARQKICGSYPGFYFPGESGALVAFPCLNR